MAPLLEYESVEISFGRRAVVRDVRFALGAGEILGIVGESGSGKSSLLRAALGLLGPGGAVSGGRAGRSIPPPRPRRGAAQSPPGTPCR